MFNMFDYYLATLKYNYFKFEERDKFELLFIDVHNLRNYGYLFTVKLMVQLKLGRMVELVNNTFLYFAYGSNLLKKRIRINNPSAEFIGIGRLNDHQLDFIKYSDHWRGTSATIIPTDTSHVWGAIWRLHINDMPALDKQEGVESNWYFAKTVDIVTPAEVTVQCRTYQQTINPPLRKNGEELPEDRRPCITYLDCIVNGAKECLLPDYYINELKKIPHNGQEASPKLIEKLNRSI